MIEGSTNSVNAVFVLGFFDLFSNYQEVCLAQEMARQGHRVSVIAGTYADGIFSDEVLRKLNLSRVYPCGQQIEGELQIYRVQPFFNYRSVVLARGVNALLRQLKPDLILAMMPGQILPTLIRKPAGARLYSIFADNRSQYLNLSPPLAAFKRAVFYLSKGPFYAWLIRHSDVVYASTPSGVSILKKITFGKTPRVLPLAFDPSVYRYDERLRVQARAEFGFSKEDLVWISTGKIIPVKQVEVLVRVFGQVRQSNPRIRLVLIGAGNDAYCDRLRGLIAELQLETSVLLLDFMPPSRIVQLLNAADIGVWHRRPAISIQQAMGTGIFCLLPNNDFVGHLLTERTGVYFPEEDWAALRSTMDRLAGLGPGHFQKARAARAAINQKFAQNRVVRMLLEQSPSSPASEISASDFQKSVL